MAKSSTNIHTGMPQHLRALDLWGVPSSVELGGGGTWPLVRELLVMDEGGQRTDGGVAMDGDGKAARMSEIDPAREDLVLPPKMSIKPALLARVRSKFAASLVARRISSGRLVWLALSPSLVRLRLSGGGRLATRSLANDPVVRGETSPLELKAVPFSIFPSISRTRGSTELCDSG